MHVPQVDLLDVLILELIFFFQAEDGIRDIGVTGVQTCALPILTYNDPTVFLEYAVDVADACRARGVRSVLVTAGYVGDEARRELYAHVDAANVDLKAFTDDFYRRGVAARPPAGGRHPGGLRGENHGWVGGDHPAIPRDKDPRAGDEGGG